MTNDLDWQSACGKVILFGEHAVVYGIKAIAAGIPNAVKARAHLHVPGVSQPALTIPAWDVSVTYHNSLDSRDTNYHDKHTDLLVRSFRLIVDALEVSEEMFEVELAPSIPAASGLGASAAVAVAIIRSVGSAFHLDLSNEQINAIAYRCEQLAHGNPSGLDNTLAVYGGLLEFQRKGSQIEFSPLSIRRPFELVVAHSGKMGFTSEMVTKVSRFREQQPDLVDALFRRIDALREQGVQALLSGDMNAFADSLNANHRCLVELGVSCPEIENVIHKGREYGSQGGKLTGSGGGGAIILATRQAPSVLCQKLNEAGIQALPITVGA